MPIYTHNKSRWLTTFTVWFKNWFYTTLLYYVPIYNYNIYRYSLLSRLRSPFPIIHGHTKSVKNFRHRSVKVSRRMRVWRIPTRDLSGEPRPSLWVTSGKVRLSLKKVWKIRQVLNWQVFKKKLVSLIFYNGPLDPNPPRETDSISN